jgi:phosphate transport system ATP-binding protein
MLDRARERASALDPVVTLIVEELIGELKERYTIVIVTNRLQQPTPAANATAFMPDRESVEHGPTTGMFANPKDESTERDVTGRFG